MTTLFALLIALSIRIVAFEPFNLPSGSMIPSLLVGDYFFVSKAAYGYSIHSLPFSPPLFHGRIFGSLPKRGDVVVFKNMHAGYADYVKRIVGLPGDHIQLLRGVLYLNGQPAMRRPVGTILATDGSGGTIQERAYTETLPGDVTYRIAKISDAGHANNTGEFVVPDGTLFALGDNRDNSLDSRFGPDEAEGPFLPAAAGVGYIPVENLVGRAQFIFFSVNETAPWWQLSEWPGEIRWGRLLSGIK